MLLLFGIVNNRTYVKLSVLLYSPDVVLQELSFRAQGVKKMTLLNVMLDTSK